MLVVCFIKVKYIKLNTFSQENFFNPNYSPRRGQRTRRIIELKELKDKDGRKFNPNYCGYGSQYLQIRGLVKKSQLSNSKIYPSLFDGKRHLLFVILVIGHCNLFAICYLRFVISFMHPCNHPVMHSRIFLFLGS